MHNFLLLGLPGLYQNWLMAAVDSASKVQLHGSQNFFCSKSKVKWLIKPGMADYPVATPGTTVLNLYVRKNNFPWYLYNLFEKTYDIKIMVDSLVADLLDRGDQFTIFNEFKNLLLQIDHTDENEVLDLFYRLFLESNYYLYGVTEFTDPLYINIEYDDFANKETLYQKLKELPDFDSSHFDFLYSQLSNRNQRYFNKKQTYLDKLLNDQPLDLIESAFTGKIVSELYDKRIDWKNPKFRLAVMKSKKQEIYDLARKICYN